MDGNASVAGFIGRIRSQDASSIDIEITNSINDGTILTQLEMACGMFCVDLENHYDVTSTVFNSITNGIINATSEHPAYGFTNNITNARNVVSNAKIIGSSNSNQFWAQSVHVSNSFGLIENCEQCGTDVSVYEMNKSNGLFIEFKSGERVDETLNNQANDCDAKWTYDLSLTTNHLSVIVGNPVFGDIIIDGLNPLGHLQKLCGLFMGSCTIFDNQTNQPIHDSSSIQNGTSVSFFSTVVLNGLVSETILVEYGTMMKDIQQLQPFMNNDFSFVNSSNKNQVFTNMTCVLHDMEITVIKNTRVVVEIDPTDDVNITDVINTIIGIINVDPGHIIVDVVRNDDGKVTIIAITVVDEETAITIVDTINSIDTGDGCDVGVLCRRKRAYVGVETLSLSCSHLSFVSLFSFILFLFVHSLF